MKRKALSVLCLLTVMMLAGCSRKDTELAVPAPVIEEDAALFSKIKEAAGTEILLFDCADYDGDGNKEAFAFVGVDNGGVLEGQRWFAGSGGAAPLKIGGESVEYLQDRSAVVETPENTAFWYTESDGAVPLIPCCGVFRTRFLLKAYFPEKEKLLRRWGTASIFCTKAAQMPLWMERDVR